MLLHKQRELQPGFTTIELLLVIGIIVLLIGLLVPVVSRVRDSARAANTSAFISQLSTAIEQYYQDFRGYPGPLSNNEIRRDNYGNPGFWPGGTIVEFTYPSPWPGEYQQVTAEGTDGRYQITMAENLVLGLLGGLKPEVNAGGELRLVYDPRLVGKGPISLNPAQPRAYPAYLEPANLSWQMVAGKQSGAFFDEASGPGGADDSIIPEFVDRYSDPMPILYLRAKVGATTSLNLPANNPVITNDLNFAVGRPGAYDISQIIGYTQPATSSDSPIGVGKKLPRYEIVGTVAQLPAFGNVPPQHGLRSVNPRVSLSKPPPSGGGFLYPYDAFAYFRDPTLSGPQDQPSPRSIPRQKDKFILISAGPDRIYGTNDDITNFGPVAP